jgi:hypothetical protein
MTGEVSAHSIVAVYGLAEQRFRPGKEVASPAPDIPRYSVSKTQSDDFARPPNLLQHLVVVKCTVVPRVFFVSGSTAHVILIGSRAWKAAWSVRLWPSSQGCILGVSSLKNTCYLLPRLSPT